jgi:acyl dehydratase
MLYFEDFSIGAVFELGETEFTEKEILEFGRAYDPQGFHVDHDQAAQSPFGGLIASGFLIASLFMRRYVEGILAHSACEGSPGIDEVRFRRPVRPGDVLRARLTVTGASPMPGRRSGIVRPRCEFLNSNEEVVFSMVLHSIFCRRPS